MNIVYLINHVDDIVPALGRTKAKEIADAAHREYGTMYIIVFNERDLMKLSPRALIELFNTTVRKFKTNDAHVSRFESKKRGAERVLDLFNRTYGTQLTPYRAKRHKSIPVNSGNGILYAREGKGINLPPRENHRQPRDGSKLSHVLCALLGSNGASLEDILTIIGRHTKSGRNIVRVYLHNLNRRCGYGVKTIHRTPGNPVYSVYR